MGVVLQHNLNAGLSQANVTLNAKRTGKVNQKLASGLSINAAGDNAAGLAVSEKLRSQIGGLSQAVSNSNDGISLIQTAEGALSEVHDMLDRIYELTIQSANNTYQDIDREAIQKEITALTDEIDRIANSTQFNGINLLDGSLAGKTHPTDPQKNMFGSRYGVHFESADGTYFNVSSSIADVKMKFTSDASGYGGENAYWSEDGKTITINLVKGETYNNSNMNEIIKHAVTSKSPNTKAPAGLDVRMDRLFTMREPFETTPTVAGQRQSLTLDVRNLIDPTGSIEGFGEQIKFTANNYGNTEDYEFLAQSIQIVTDSAAGREYLEQSDAYYKGKNLTIHLSTGKGYTNSDIEKLLKRYGYDYQVDMTSIVDPKADGVCFFNKIDLVGCQLSSEGISYQFDKSMNIPFKKEEIDSFKFTDLFGSQYGIHYEIPDSGSFIDIYSNAADIKIKFTPDGSGVGKEDSYWSGDGKVLTLNLIKDKTYSNRDINELIDRASTNNMPAGSVPADLNVIMDNPLTMGESFETFPNETGQRQFLNLDIKNLINSSSTLEGFGEQIKFTAKHYGTTWDYEFLAQAIHIVTDGDAGSEFIELADTDTKGKDLTIHLATDTKYQNADIENLLKRYGFDYQVDITNTVDPDKDGVCMFNRINDVGCVLSSDGVSYQYGKSEPTPFTQEDIDNMKFIVNPNPTNWDGEFVLNVNRPVSGGIPAANIALLNGGSSPVLTVYNSSWQWSPMTYDLRNPSASPTQFPVYHEHIPFDRGSIDSYAIGFDHAEIIITQTVTALTGENEGKYEITYNVVNNTSTNDDIRIDFSLGMTSDKFQGSTFVKLDEYTEGHILTVDVDDIWDAEPSNIDMPDGKLNIHWNGNPLPHYDPYSGADSANSISFGFSYVITSNPELEPDEGGKTIISGELEGGWGAGLKGIWSAGFEGSWGAGLGNFTSDKTMGGNGGLILQIGANGAEDQTITITIGDMTCEGIELSKPVEITPWEKALKTLEDVYKAINNVSMQRSELGAFQNRLGHTIKNLTNAYTDMTSAESVIRDTDMASEMSEYIKSAVLEQAGEAMLAQANQAPQNILSLIQG